MSNRLIMARTDDGVRVDFVRESVRGERLVLATVQMTLEQARSLGTDLALLGWEPVRQELDPASTFGG